MNQGEKKINVKEGGTMTSIILLIKGTIGVPFVKAFHDWDWAELQLVKINETVIKSNPNNFAKLIEVPYEGEIDNKYPADIEITHVGSELLLMYLGEEVLGEVTLETDVEEELFHQECPPNTKPTYNISKITICGVPLDDMKLTKELKAEITSEAEAYRDEMIEQIGEPED